MELAVDQAKLSALEMEVPVGAIVLHKNKVIASGRNRREKLNNSLYHAEIEAINKACLNLKSWRLLECTIYITLEPCPMCAGAIINSRIPSLVYGAKDYKSGCCGSVINLFEFPFNHKPEIISGVLEQKCSRLLSNFFKNLRRL